MRRGAASKRLLPFVLLLAAGPALKAASFNQALELSAAGEYSGFQNGPGAINAPARAFYLPLIGLGKNDILAPVLLVDFKARERPATEEGEPYLERWLFLARPSYKHRFNEAWDLSVNGSAKRTTTNEEFRRPWSKGLYDYEEFGAGAKVSGSKVGFLPELSLGASWAHRDYPNFRNPAPEGGKNYYIKDLGILKADLDLGLPAFAGIKHGLQYSFSQRGYTDSYLSKFDGTLDKTLRSEMFHMLSWQAGKAFSRNLEALLTLEGSFNQSNQNQYDFTNNEIIENSASFQSISVAPSLRWLIQGKPDGHSLALSYKGLSRAWTGKRVRNSDGTYTQGTQTDAEHSLLLKGTYAGIIKGLSLFAITDYESSQSNQGYEAGIRYTYDLFIAQLGLEYRL